MTEIETPVPPAVYSIKEFRKLSGLSTAYIEYYGRRGRLHPLRIGNRVFILGDEGRRLMAQRALRRLSKGEA